MHAQFAPLLDRRQRAWNRSMVSLATVLAIVIACWYYVGLFDAERLGEGIPSLASLVGEMFPPNFSQAGSWVKPLLDTLAMSVAGTAVAVRGLRMLGAGRVSYQVPHRITHGYGLSPALVEDMVALQPDLAICGGISEAMKIAAIASMIYLAIFPRKPNSVASIRGCRSEMASIRRFAQPENAKATIRMTSA